MYSVEIGLEDMQLLQAAVLGCVRRMQEHAPKQEAIKFTTAAAEAISRLNHGSIDQTDVRFLCTCIQKTVDLVHGDEKVPQRATVIAKCEALQHKLEGYGGAVLIT
jgi:hypothetical protein